MAELKLTWVGLFLIVLPLAELLGITFYRQGCCGGLEGEKEREGGREGGGGRAEKGGGEGVRGKGGGWWHPRLLPGDHTPVCKHGLTPHHVENFWKHLLWELFDLWIILVCVPSSPSLPQSPIFPSPPCPLLVGLNKLILYAVPCFMCCSLLTLYVCCTNKLEQIWHMCPPTSDASDTSHSVLQRAARSGFG